MLLKIKSPIISRLILYKIVGENKYMKLFKYNKIHQKKFDLSFKDYQYFIPIKIELIPVEPDKLKRKENYFINFKDKRHYYDIYFNDDNKIIYKDYFTENDNVRKIKVHIKHKVDDLSELFYIQKNEELSGCDCIKEIKFTRFHNKYIDDMSCMFYGCSSVNKISFAEFESENVKNMSNMFHGCISLYSIDLSKFNTEKVINMNSMFSKCLSLREIDLSKFNTKNVVDMGNLFENCVLLEKIKNFNFKTNNVTHMNSMFENCSSLPLVAVTHFVTDKVVSFENMFKNCYDLSYLDISCFEFKEAACMKNMFSCCNNFFKKEIKEQNEDLDEEAFQDNIDENNKK